MFQLFPYRPHKTPLQTRYLEFSQSTISRFPEIDFPIQQQTSLVDVYPLGVLLSSTVRKKEPIQLAVSNSYLPADYQMERRFQLNTLNNLISTSKVQNESGRPTKVV